MEAATSFKFPGYKYFDESFGKERELILSIQQKNLFNSSFWIIVCTLGVYDKELGEFGYYLTYNYEDSTRFDDVYEAYEVVKGLIK